MIRQDVFLVVFFVYLVFVHFPNREDMHFKLLRMFLQVMEVAARLLKSTTYIPCFFWSSRSSLYRVLTPSIMTWTS